MINLELKTCGSCQHFRQNETVLHWNDFCLYCQPASYSELVDILKECFTKKQELENENSTHQQALATSQEWHERQKAEIIAQWKTKLQTFINQRKSQLQAEIQLIREVLHE